MFSKQARKPHRSLALRLTLWYAGIFTLSACIAFFFFYLLITSVIRERTDEELQSRAATFATVLSLQGLEAAKRLAVLEAQAAGEKKVFLRLLHPSGKAFSSSNMSYWRNITVEEDAIRMLLEGEHRVFKTVVVSTGEQKNRLRLLYGVIGPGVIIQTGHSMENHTRLVETFRKIFITTMSALFAVSALSGWFMARGALSGFNIIARTARRIAAGELQERVPVKARHDEIDQLAGTFNHMLDRIQALVTSIRDMSDNIAHDLKSPIARIRGTAEITLTSNASLEDYRQMAAGTIEDCDHLLDMINTMLMISRTEAGVHQPDRVPLDLAVLTRRACELFQPLAEDKNLTLKCDAPAECILDGDIRMIQRMIANLLDNAVKYTPPGGRIAVAVRCNNGRQSAVISVKDTGIGITEDDRPHIFERFYRCDRSRSQTGAGLGLSLAEAIAEAHGGAISVISGSNAGSTFTVTLPAGQTAA